MLFNTPKTTHKLFYNKNEPFTQIKDIQRVYLNKKNLKFAVYNLWLITKSPYYALKKEPEKQHIKNI
jgi:hypothetical protein